jgi:hypothetical protein
MAADFLNQGAAAPPAQQPPLPELNRGGSSAAGGDFLQNLIQDVLQDKKKMAIAAVAALAFVFFVIFLMSVIFGGDSDVPIEGTGVVAEVTTGDEKGKEDGDKKADNKDEKPDEGEGEKKGEDKGAEKDPEDSKAEGEGDEKGAAVAAGESRDGGTKVNWNDKERLEAIMKGEAPPPPADQVAQNPDAGPTDEEKAAAEAAAAAEAEAAKAAEAKRAAPAPKKRRTRTVTVKAPTKISWVNARNRLLKKGSGKFEVPAGTKFIYAYDRRRRCTTKVKLKPGTLNYSSLPKGKLSVRAFPFATVYVGQDKIGQTPFPPASVVAGKCEIVLKHESKIKKKNVVIRAGKTTTIKENMTK